MWEVRLGGDNGELRPWHSIYPCESACECECECGCEYECECECECVCACEVRVIYEGRRGKANLVFEHLDLPADPHVHVLFDFFGKGI